MKLISKNIGDMKNLVEQNSIKFESFY